MRKIWLRKNNDHTVNQWLIPYYYDGTLEGEVLVAGKKVSKQPVCETAKLVGSVFQNPRSQFFNVDSTSEIVFGCENMAGLFPILKSVWNKYLMI